MCYFLACLLLLFTSVSIFIFSKLILKSLSIKPAPLNNAVNEGIEDSNNTNNGTNNRISTARSGAISSISNKATKSNNMSKLEGRYNYLHILSLY